MVRPLSSWSKMVRAFANTTILQFCQKVYFRKNQEHEIYLTFLKLLIFKLNTSTSNKFLNDYEYLF